MTWERFAADRAKAEAEIERLQDALEREQREHATCEKVNAQRFQVLTDAIIDLTKQNAAMRRIVEAVASPLDVVREHVCMCDGPYDGPHEPHCIVAQARAYVAAHPVKSEA